MTPNSESVRFIDLRKYPCIRALGLKLHTDKPGPAGINARERRSKLCASELRRWNRDFGGGITVGENGIYPHDVEVFLRGGKNYD